MLKSLFISNFKNAPKGLIVCLLLVLIFSPLLYQLYKSKTPHSDRITLTRRTQLKTDINMNYDVLLLGDSRFLLINEPQKNELFSKLPFSFRNYSIPEHGMASYYLTLRKYLKQNQPPKLLVLGFSPITFTNHGALDQTKTEHLHRLALFHNLKDSLSALPLNTHFALLKTKLEQTLFLIAYRKTIKKQLCKSLSNPYFCPINSSDSNKLLLIDSIYWKENFKLNNTSVQWFKKCLILAKENNIKVFIIYAPIRELLLIHRAQSGFMQRHHDFLSEVEQEFENVIISKPTTYGFFDEYFMDFHHLNNKGIKKFSEQMFRELYTIYKESDF